MSVIQVYRGMQYDTNVIRSIRNDEVIDTHRVIMMFVMRESDRERERERELLVCSVDRISLLYDTQT